MSFQPRTVLFDKGVVRRVYEARVRFALRQPPTLQQAEAANVWARLRSLLIPLYITEQTVHILQRRSPLFAAELLTQTQALKKGRYLRRWARRLRAEGVSSEDAIVNASDLSDPVHRNASCTFIACSTFPSYASAVYSPS